MLLYVKNLEASTLQNQVLRQAGKLADKIWAWFEILKDCNAVD